jgi:hypothetical protein
MKSKRLTLGVVGVVAGLMMMPVNMYGVQAPGAQHDHHSATASPPESASQAPANRPKMGMMMSGAKLDEIVKTMNAAKGGAKVDAMAELLTVLVENQRTACGPMMADMMTMMSMMRKMGDKGHDSAPDEQK